MALGQLCGYLRSTLYTHPHQRPFRFQRHLNSNWPLHEMELTFQEEQGDHCSLQDFLAYHLTGGRPPAFLHLPSPTFHFPLPSLLFWGLLFWPLLSVPYGQCPNREGQQPGQAIEFVGRSLASEVLGQPQITPKNWGGVLRSGQGSRLWCQTAPSY